MAKTGTLFIIRHGQTDWNAERRLQGQRDIPLNDFGRSQAAENGRKLALFTDIGNFDFISSPLSRARETMEIARSNAGLAPGDYRLEERLKEVCFGDWEGFTLKEVATTAPERVRERRKAKWDFIPPGDLAESYEILSWRVGSWLKDIDRPTVAVCHGGVVRCIFKLLGDIDKELAAELPIPQEKILKVENGTLEWI